MTDKLPPQLLALFQARPALRYLPPTDHAPETRSTGPIDGLAAFLPALQEEPAPYTPTESWLQKTDRERLEKAEAVKKLVTEDVKNFNPHEDPNIKGDPFKTLFIGRLDYKINEAQLKSTFRQYGPIVNIRIPVDDLASAEEKKKKPHVGYAFIEFERESDMKNAYKDTNHMMLGSRRIVTDVERGRTTKDWYPVRFGGGLGGRGHTKEPIGRPMGGYGQGAGGHRGGFGFRGRGGGGGFGGRGGFSDRGGYGGGRYGGGGRAPEGAPSGPRGPRGGGYSGGGGHGPSNGYSGGGGGGRYDDRDRDRDRDRHRGYGSGGNREPLGSSSSSGGGGGGGGGGGYRDRDRDNDRKRPYEGGGGYDESRQRRRY